MCGARECEAPSCETVTMQDYPLSANRKLGEQVGGERCLRRGRRCGLRCGCLNLLVASGRRCSTRCSGEMPCGSQSIRVARFRRRDRCGELPARRQATAIYGSDPDSWELVTSHAIAAALPAQPPPLVVRRPVALANGLFVAGDHRDTASIQGALVSGRRAATAVLAELGVRPTRL